MPNMSKQPLNVAAPWGLSHYIPLNGFHPLYRALFDHAPEHVTLSAWDNVKLDRCLRSDIKICDALLRKAKAEKFQSDRLARNSVARAYWEYVWPPNQVLTAELSGDLEFHHTAPFPSLQRPFIFHCEMFAPIWFPFSQQGSGGLKRISEIREHYRGIFANPLCLGIFSHVPETLHALSQFFTDPRIDHKLFPSRIGLSENGISNLGLSKKSSLQCPRFLFMNSANQDPGNFFRRGGHIVLRFWKEYLADGRDGLLMLRCAKPSDKDLNEYGVDAYFVREQTGRSIVWGQDYLANHEMNALMESAHFFLLPSASLHSVSIVQAMTLGAIPVVTDTVGTSVYVTDNENGIVLRGMHAAIWHKDESTGILVDRYYKTPDLDDSLVAQLIDRVCTMLDRPGAYWKMRNCMMTYARDEFSGQAFSDHFWNTVSVLYQRYQECSRERSGMTIQERRSSLDCTVRGHEWARAFEGPTHPMLRINTGHSVVWELGGALIHTYGNPPFELNDWSVLAKYYNVTAPQSTFAHTLEELGGKYFDFSGSTGGNTIYKLISWIIGVLKPYPAMYTQAARVWRKMRRYHSYFEAKLRKSKASDLNIELVLQGVSGYNIIRHIDRYYAIPQSEGAFNLVKAESGGYSACFSGYSLEQVERAVLASHDSDPRLPDSHCQLADKASKS
jgi:glycosyltransferase involved in cell wall biosynthesis